MQAPNVQAQCPGGAGVRMSAPGNGGLLLLLQQACQRLKSAAALFPATFLAACSASPAQNMFGSFFPAWMLCAAAGIVIAIILRQAFGAVGVNPYLIAPPLTYLSIAVAGTLLVWLLLFGH